MQIALGGCRTIAERNPQGAVALVGAGPGDPDLLTLKGRACLARAEAVVYDRLVDRALLDLAPPAARRFYVGKARGGPSVTQAEVTGLVVRLARAGLRVVRLKGGDPFLFGRGAEEVSALARAGMPFEVVPGVSSATGVPAAAGIPLTDRRVSSSCAVVTGHLPPADPDNRVAWGALAQAVDTIVVLMGMQHLEAIATTLIENGRPAQGPAAVVEWGTHARQRTIVGTTADIAARARDAGAGAPAVVVFGDVVALRAEGGRVPAGDSLEALLRP